MPGVLPSPNTRYPRSEAILRLGLGLAIGTTIIAACDSKDHGPKSTPRSVTPVTYDGQPTPAMPRSHQISPVDLPKFDKAAAHTTNKLITASAALAQEIATDDKIGRINGDVLHTNQGDGLDNVVAYRATDQNGKPQEVLILAVDNADKSVGIKQATGFTIVLENNPHDFAGLNNGQQVEEVGVELLPDSKGVPTPIVTVQMTEHGVITTYSSENLLGNAGSYGNFAHNIYDPQTAVNKAAEVLTRIEARVQYPPLLHD